MARILLVGTATLDLVFGLDHHPGPDEEMRAHSLRTCRGGNAANTAVVLSRLGHEAEFFGALADAPESAVIERDFDRHGVVYASCPRLPGRPPTSSIYLDGPNRSIVHYRDLPELSLQHFHEIDPGAFDVIHFECRNVEVLQRVMADMRDRFPGVRISLELEKPRPGMEVLFDSPDLLICSRGFALYHGYAAPDDFLGWMRARSSHAVVVLAWGAEGAFGQDAHGRIAHAPAARLDNVVDTLGAGDTFNAALLDAYVRQVPLTEALALACALAGRKCRTHGFDI